jgi:ribosomal protein L7/L12
MKITLDLKEIEYIINLGVKALFKETSNVTDIVTPLGTFHINNARINRKNICDTIIEATDRKNILEATKYVRLNIGCRLKDAKYFCEKIRDDQNFRDSWVNGSDDWIHANWDPTSIDFYLIWLNKTET